MRQHSEHSDFERQTFLNSHHKRSFRTRKLDSKAEQPPLSRPWLLETTDYLRVRFCRSIWFQRNPLEERLHAIQTNGKPSAPHQPFAIRDNQSETKTRHNRKHSSTQTQRQCTGMTHFAPLDFIRFRCLDWWKANSAVPRLWFDSDCHLSIGCVHVWIWNGTKKRQSLWDKWTEGLNLSDQSMPLFKSMATPSRFPSMCSKPLGHDMLLGLDSQRIPQVLSSTLGDKSKRGHSHFHSSLPDRPFKPLHRRSESPTTSTSNATQSTTKRNSRNSKSKTTQFENKHRFTIERSKHRQTNSND